MATCSDCDSKRYCLHEWHDQDTLAQAVGLLLDDHCPACGSPSSPTRRKSATCPARVAPDRPTLGFNARWAGGSRNVRGRPPGPYPVTEEGDGWAC